MHCTDQNWMMQEGRILLTINISIDTYTAMLYVHSKAQNNDPSQII